MGKYRIAGIQIETSKNINENLKKVKGYLESVVGDKPDFIVLPEMFEIVVKPDEVKNYTHPVPCELTDMICHYALKYRVNIIGGSLFEDCNGKIYNTSVIVNRDGNIVGKYRKMHLFDAFGFGESQAITAGEEPFLGELDGLKFGVGICYDIRFPELFRYYAVRGAEIVFVPAAFFQPNHDHWILNIRSRALDNTIFIATANQTGRLWVGRSMVANPWGIGIASAGVEEGYYLVEIDTEEIVRVRKKLPTLSGIRFGVDIKKY